MNMCTLFLVDGGSPTRSIDPQLWVQTGGEGYQVHEFATGLAALQRCQTAMPDVMVVGEVLADGEGLEFLRRLKQQTGHDRLPVVFVMEREDLAIAMAALQTGAQDCLVNSQLTPESWRAAIHKAQSRVQKLNQEFEAQVAQRTAPFQASERRFRALFDHTIQFVGLLTPEGLVLEANQTALEFGGFSLSEIIHRPFWEAPWWTVSTQTQIQLQQAIAQAAQGESVRYEVEVRGTGQQMKTLDFSIRPLRNESGQVVFLIPEGRDISEYKQAQEDLKRSQSINQAILQALPDLIVHMTGEGQYLTFCSGGGVKVIPIQEPVRNNTVYSVMPPAIAEKRMDYVRRALETGERQTYEYEIVIEGELRYEEARIMVCGNNEVLLIIRDITERCKAELALRESEARLQAILDSAPLSIFIKDLQGQYLCANPAYERLCGYTEAQLLEMSDYDLLPDEAARICALTDQAALRENRTTISEETVPFGPGERVVLVSKFPLLDAHQQPYAVCGIAVDLSDRKQAELALRRSESKHRALIEALPDLIMRMSGDGIYLDFFPARNFKIYGSVDLVGKNIYAEGLPYDIAHLRMGYIKRALQTGELQIHEQQLWIEGALRTEEVRITICGDNEVLVIVRDITDRKHTERAWQQLNQELEDRVEQRTVELRQSEARFQRIAANAPGTIYQFALYPDGFYEFVYISDRCQELTEIAPEVVYQNADALLTLIHPEDQQGFWATLQASARHLQRWFWEGRFTTPSGKLKWMQAMSQPALQANGTVIWDGLIIDLSDRKQAELAIQESERRLSTLISNLPGYVYRVQNNADYTADYISEGVWAITGYHPEEYTCDRTISCGQEIFPEDCPGVWQTIQTALANHQPYECTYRILTKAGQPKWVWERGRGVYDESSELLYLEGFVTDITERKQAELEIVRNRDLREAIFHESTDAIFLVDRQTRLTLDCNRRAVELFEAKSKADLIGIEGQELQREPFSEAEAIAIIAAVDQQGVWNQELEYLTHQGRIFWGSLAVKKIRVGDREMNLVRVTDISDRKQADEKIRASLREKEVLLKEIHHRVKNNLHITSSLLKLQARTIQDPEVLSIFRDSQNRVRSMALIHEKLYQSKDLAALNFAEYVHNLATAIFRSYGVNPQLIKLQVDVIQVGLNVDVAIPCGLIINELISNSLKYAFPTEKTGQVWVELRLNDQGQYVLTVGDNGIGFPADVDYRQASSLGLRLVCSLTEQLGGTVELERGAGTLFQIIFNPLPDKK